MIIADQQPEHPDPKILTRMAKVLGDQDCFVVLYDLCGRDEPVGVGELSRAYRVDPSYMKDLVTNLVTFGLATKRGQSYLAPSPVRSAIGLMELAFKGVQPEARSPAAAENALVWSASGTPIAQTSTNNGTWMALSTRFVVTTERSNELTSRDRSGNASSFEPLSLGSQGKADATPDYASL